MLLASQAVKDRRDQIAKEIGQRDANSNGIYLSTPEVYDDSSLQQMLKASRAKLAAIQGLDQATLTAHLGAISGSTLQQSAFSAQIAGPPIPQTVTTLNGATSSVADVTGTSPSTTTTTTAPNQSVATTSPQPVSPIPGPPADTAFTLPSTFAGSAIDALNEEMQLTYEIANLHLLLEGSLTDRFVLGQRLIKPRTTIGLNLTPKFKDAVAILEVAVEKPFAALLPEATDPPAVTALLPREKTYNVAKVTDKMTSLGAGIVTHVLTAGASWTGGRKTFYVVQDQDTVASMLPALESSKRTAFYWQFRPVLGQRFVRDGMRQNFVQLAVPVTNVAGCFGKVHVITYWRQFDRDSGLVGSIIRDSVREQDVRPIPVFDLAPMVGTLDYEDIGGGLVQVQVGGKFLSGTYIRIGNNFYRDGVLGFTSEATHLRFVAPAAEIAVHRAYIVSRDGKEVEILDPSDPRYRRPLTTSCEPPDPAPPSDSAAPTASDAQKHPKAPSLSSTLTAVDGSNVLLVATATDLP